MAHVVDILSNSSPKSYISGLVGELRLRVERRRVYNRTYAELNSLSTRELDDLGIARSMISRLAQEAASKI
ncbi:MAG: DUF1127 domain-containing protein [Roseinatronobacter sp.]